MSEAISREDMKFFIRGCEERASRLQLTLKPQLIKNDPTVIEKMVADTAKMAHRGVTIPPSWEYFRGKQLCSTTNGKCYPTLAVLAEHVRI